MTSVLVDLVWVDLGLEGLMYAWADVNLAKAVWLDHTRRGACADGIPCSFLTHISIQMYCVVIPEEDYECVALREAEKD